MGWNLKRDASERPIVQALRKVGCQVLQLDKFDLLVLAPHGVVPDPPHVREDYRDVWMSGFRAGRLLGRLHMLECKTGRAKATEAQDRLIEEGWPLQYVADTKAALKAIGAV